MKKSTLLLLATVASVLTMGAGCATNDTADETSYNYSTTSSISTTSSTDGNDDLAISATVEPGMEFVTTESGTISQSTKNYVAALKIYQKNGYRFQFSDCSGNPGSLNIKKGTNFMIDNRDGETHQIKIGTKTYRLAAYDFAIVNVQRSGSFNITCDGGGSAHVNIED